MGKEISWAELRRRANAKEHEDNLKWSFSYLLKWLKKEHSAPPAVIIAYLFQQVEYVHRMALYCAIVKKFNTDPEFTKKKVLACENKRKDYMRKVGKILQTKIPPSLSRKLDAAASLRNKCVHESTRKPPWEPLYAAVADVLDYARDFNELFQRQVGIAPFQSLQGKLSGKGIRATRLSPAATEAKLKSLGIR